MSSTHVMARSRRTTLGLLVAAMFSVATLSACESTGADGADAFGAEDTCKDWVKDKLKAPSTADFENVSTSGSNPWTVTGDVDAENGFGAKIRSAWTCEIRLDDDDYYRGSATLLE